ncbi:uncharacterized protein B0H18DRAFT_1127584 [Fomitopsis serialis]|uniref:uncharacterized protein n=1 Tax=Fomitopsis serialis TaxID=139415 RepID=UPI0020086751|nr:uncharacterized protein B0H18DRAFT_1127584 [Neoantrodia serialis]KAH9912130.1 hypothetical protein B0H18DRAFT_1127584 [Neoantrodia serialis]
MASGGMAATGKLANQVTDSEDDSDTESSIGSMSRTSSVSHTFEVPSSKRPLAKPSGTKAKPTPVRRPIKKRAREESDDEVGGISRPARASGAGAHGAGVHAWLRPPDEAQLLPAPTYSDAPTARTSSAKGGGESPLVRHSGHPYLAIRAWI